MGPVPRIRVEPHPPLRPHQRTRLAPPPDHASTPPRLSRYSSISDCPFGDGILAAFPHLTHLNIRSSNATSFLFSLSFEQGSLPARFLFLEGLTLGFETPRGHESITPLRRHNITSAIASEFRQLCGILTTVLANRDRYGCRLSRLEFFSYEEGCMAENASLVSHIDLAALSGELVEDGIKPLKALVDGPVVFSGYHFFTHAPEPSARPGWY
ncbi:hypothetical protein LXA43DRAFT_1010955 [Ganoderma leucocontextum]|nr:hypothetical protein LXA43DRAFT_1010955 [Ganoderma leucocontextum]